MRDIEGTSLKIDKIVKKNNNKIGKLWRRTGRIETLSDEFILICMEANMLEDMNFKIEDFKKKWIEDSKENLWYKVCNNL